MSLCVPMRIEVTREKYTYFYFTSKASESKNGKKMLCSSRCCVPSSKRYNDESKQMRSKHVAKRWTRKMLRAKIVCEPFSTTESSMLVSPVTAVYWWPFFTRTRECIDNGQLCWYACCSHVLSIRMSKNRMCVKSFFPFFSFLSTTASSSSSSFFLFFFS